jgi:hypothetical protein
MKKSTLLTVLLFGCLAYLVSCGGSNSKVQGTSDSDDPLGKLMAKKEKLMANGIISEVATATSRDMQTGRNKVEMECRGQLTRSMEAKTSSMQKGFKEEVGEEFLEHFTQVTKTVSSRILKGTTLTETPYKKNENGKYDVYGIMVLDTKAFADALAAEINSNEAMKTRWLASKGYKDLEKEVEAFETFKKEQQTP